MTPTDSALLAHLIRWRWPLGILGGLLLIVLVVLLEPLTPRHRQQVAGDEAAAALRAKGDQTMTALKETLKDPLQDQFGELWLANGKIVCGFVNVLDGSPSYGGWEPFVGHGGLVYRITDKSRQGKAWFRSCAFGRIRMIYPGYPGSTEMEPWVDPIPVKARN